MAKKTNQGRSAMLTPDSEPEQAEIETKLGSELVGQESVASPSSMFPAGTDPQPVVQAAITAVQESVEQDISKEIGLIAVRVTMPMIAGEHVHQENGYCASRITVNFGEGTHEARVLQRLTVGLRKAGAMYDGNGGRRVVVSDVADTMRWLMQQLPAVGAEAAY